VQIVAVDALSQLATITASNITTSNKQVFRTGAATTQLATYQSERLNLMAARDKLAQEEESLRGTVSELQAGLEASVTRAAYEAQERRTQGAQRGLAAVRSLYRALHSKYSTLQSAVLAAQAEAAADAAVPTAATATAAASTDSTAAAAGTAVTVSSSSSSSSSSRNSTASSSAPQSKRIAEALGERHRAGMSASRVIEQLLLEVNSLKALVESSGAKGGTNPKDGGLGAEGYEPPGNMFKGLGSSASVPSYLQCEGLVRNWNMPRAEAARLAADIVRLTLEAEAKSRATGAAAARAAAAAADAAEAASSSAAASSDSAAVAHAVAGAFAAEASNAVAAAEVAAAGCGLQTVYSEYIRERFDRRGLAVEFAYNLKGAVDSYSAEDCALRAFGLALAGALPATFYTDQAALFELLRAGFAAAEVDRSSGNGGSCNGKLPHLEATATLRALLPRKPRASLDALCKALRFDTAGSADVQYLKLLELDEDDRCLSRFAETLREQHLSEALTAVRRAL
jgi:trimeric autotransporter adhesin